MNPSTSDGLPVPQRYAAILVIALGIMMAVLDGTIANVALPTIARDLNTSPATSIWVVNAYQLAITISLLSMASLGDIIGYRRVYQAGLLIFSVTSLFCALSDSLWTLTFARVLQGFGAAALMSVNTALIRIIYPRAQLGRGIGINTLIVAVSSAAGPSIAAAVLSVASWQWLFALNVPIGLLAWCLGIKFLPANNTKSNGNRFDITSCVLNALTFGLLIIAISGFSQGQSPAVIAAQVVALLLIGFFFVRRQLTQSFPLLPVDLLRIPIFALSIGTSIFSFAAQMLAMVSLPFFLQTVLGRDEVATGLLLTPWPLATMVIAPIAGRLVERYHAGLLGGIGLAVFASGLFLLAVLPANPSDVDIIWRMILCGAGFGLFQTPNNHTIISAAPQHRSGGASGMLGTARLLGQTSGAALVALMFNMFSTNGTHASLILAGCFASIAALVSLLRVTQKSH
ncbi:major Facilitator Superfamily protein [Yersinia pseudotuberculosis IP 32953]|uniref:MFS Superfamily multidrug efflux transporter n=3 Tax=Yersinia pseudotuberculosis TaxID=633 RepID=Q669W3_YERPS|nr:MFS transporter [Yersinia pseudotuberculosis]CQD49434.1 putative transport protein [Yersinia intermedia]AJJ04737.1 major Facilitator Superfamily protein [Yersinia pseudotuberculosis]AJJ56672.1 major Facilitator Superfamily protein [Yersinia pseudotuberculosis IP 32953]AJJ69282.1 major Facilitator Superfamily protein [Yersinia pseudotuberculosis PB1/+]AJJ71793.1 major Facilitator Superfamily protein [Yersinia pseudotuberculosis]